MTNNFRAGCASLAVVAGLLGGQCPVWAQASTVQEVPTNEAPTAAAQDEATIVVTGSRIRRDPLDLTAPVTFVDRADIDRTGLVSTAEILQRLPSSGGGLNSRFNNSGNFGNPPDGGGVGAGAAEIDLRYLGSRRVLVLVDGLRYVNGASASGVPGSTDINSIPESMIERIEVLQDGASAIYGSDAIAGVVNIITKKRQDGFIASAQYGQYLGEGDGETQNYQLSWGEANDEHGFSIVIGGNYVDQNPVSSADREISLFPTPGATQCDSSCSSGTPLGRFIVLGQDLTLRAPVIGRPVVFNPANPTDPASDFKAFTTLDRFNFAPFNFIQIPVERYGGFITLRKELGAVANLTLKAIYNRRESKNQAAPLPLFVGPDAGNGNLLDTIVIDATNPFNPFGQTLAPGSYNFIGRRFVENGPRQYNQKVDTYYVTGTLDGEFGIGDSRWFWDVNGVVGQNEAEQVVSGNINAANLARALGPVANCTAPCVPFNIFGGAGSITPEMINYVAFVQDDSSKQELWDVTANLTGSLFDLPAGPLGLAVGYEHRDQEGRFDPDPVVAAGLGSDIPARPTSGGFNVDEVYGELSIPLLADMSFFNELDVSLAARLSDYSTSGSTTTFKAGVNWKPIADLRLRGSWAEGFRAPSIGELFGTASRFDQEVVDPCSAVNGEIPAAVRANCIAQGVPADGSYVQLNPQISVLTGGNENLEPETSESWVVGAVYSPSFIPRLTLEANYYDITVDGAIQAIAATTLLGRCANANDALSCAAISRTASGQISQINGILQNIASIETDGLDVSINYRTAPTGLGTFGLYWTNTFLFNYTVTVPATNGTTEIEREGTEQGSPDQAFPRYKSTAILDWSLGQLGASLTGRYISSVLETQTVTATDPGNKLERRLYVDVQLRWNPDWMGEGLGFAVGVNNLFDTDPPACFSCGLNNFDPTTYDVPGQFGYVRATLKL